MNGVIGATATAIAVGTLLWARVGQSVGAQEQAPSTPPGQVDPDQVDQDKELTGVTVTATRLAQPTFDVPASISAAPIEQNALGVNADESLQGIPGLVARSRQNYAQDEQVSIRGFGARASFGIVGVRVYMDGIPSSQPDGQGQVSQFNLSSADHIEVLRGPFSALYGNSAGGVIQLFTAEGSGSPRVDAGVAYGSFAQRRADVGLLGAAGPFSFNMGALQFATNGSRGHSAAQRTSVNGKFGLDLYGGGRLTLLFNYFHSPHAQDPLGLTQAQFNADPQSTAPTAAQLNTRKSAEQTQGGAIYELPVDEHNTLRLMGYVGHREVLQFQGIPVATQLAPTSPGGAISLSNTYAGGEPRWTYQSQLYGGDFSVTGGLDYDNLEEQREGFNNFVGAQLGVLGELRRRELDRVYDFDQFVQAQWQPLARWGMLVGVRRSQVNFSSTDQYIPPGQQSTSGSVSYGATSPVGGLRLRLTPGLNLYAAYGDGFETPTLDELAYRPNGAAGLNFDLHPSRSQSYEVGAKMYWSNGGAAEAALFRANTDNEIVVQQNVGGRSIYANAGRSEREGLELQAQTQLGPHLQGQLAYTYLHALIRSAYLTCAAAPCTVPTALVPAGSRIPSLPDNLLYVLLQWQVLPNWSWQLRDDYSAAFFANDLNTAYAGAYNLLGVATDYNWSLSGGTLRGFVRLDNLLNREYAGSVIVNASAGQYYEAGPGRAVLVGVSFAMR